MRTIGYECGSSSSSVAGSSTKNEAPCPYSLSHQTVPPIASAIFLTMDKPKPVECSPPVGCAESRANLPKSFAARILNDERKPTANSGN